MPTIIENFNEQIAEIVPEQNWEFQYASNSLSISFYFNDSTDEDNITLASVEVKNSLGQARWINYKLFGASPAQYEVSDNEITYFSCFPHVDVRYEVIGNKLKETIIVNERNDMSQYTFSIKSDGCTSSIVDNEIIFTDVDTGEELWRIEKPNIVDFGNNETDALRYEYTTVEYKGVEYDAITLVINDAYFLENAIYPIFIDPTTIVTLSSIAYVQYLESGATRICVFSASSIIYIYKSTNSGVTWSSLCRLQYVSGRTELPICRPLLHGSYLYLLTTSQTDYQQTRLTKININTQTDVLLSGSAQTVLIEAVAPQQIKYFSGMVIDGNGDFYLTWTRTVGTSVPGAYKSSNLPSLSPTSIHSVTWTSLSSSIVATGANAVYAPSLYLNASGHACLIFTIGFPSKAPELVIKNLTLNSSQFNYSLSDIYPSGFNDQTWCYPSWNGNNVDVIIHRRVTSQVYMKRFTSSGATLSGTHTLFTDHTLNTTDPRLTVVRIGSRIVIFYLRETLSGFSYRIVNQNNSATPYVDYDFDSVNSKNIYFDAMPVYPGGEIRVAYSVNVGGANRSLIYDSIKFNPRLRTRVSGVWKESESVHVRVGGSWKEVESVYVRVDGSWKEAE